MSNWANSELEKAVLGTALVLGTKSFVIMSARLSKDSFSLPAHAEVWLAMESIAEQGHEIEKHSVAEELRQRRKENTVKLTVALEDLENYAADSLKKAETQAHQLYQLASSRRIEQAVTRCLTKSKNSRDPDEFRAFVQKEITEATQVQSRARVYSTVEVMELVYNRITHADGAPVKVPTGLSRLDAMLGGGWMPGHLIVVAGRPGMGKTAALLRFAQASSAAGKRALVLSLEMSAPELGERIASDIADINSRELDRAENLQRLCRALEQAAQINAAWVDCWDMTIHEIRAIAFREHMKEPLGLILVDYLQIIQPGVESERRDMDIGKMTRVLLGIAKDLQVPVIALAQLNRDVEKRQDKRPNLADLRESGNIEQDAYCICFLYRDEYYNENSPRKGEADIIIAKQRGGETGSIAVGFDRTRTRFFDLGGIT